MDNRDTTKVYSLNQNIGKLERLIEALRDGKSYQIQVDNEKITVPADAEFSIEHERQDGEQELEFQFRWKTSS